MFGIRDQLLSTKQERLDQLEALDEIADNEAHARHFDFLYENLSILDSKAAALLQFNSILLAVISIFQSAAGTKILSASYGICILLTLFSCLLSLYIVWIHWSKTDELQNVERHCRQLFKVRRNRTIIYRVGWYLAFTSVLLFLCIKTTSTMYYIFYV
jgi:hypothetical protein